MNTTPPTSGKAADPISIIKRCQDALFATLPPDSNVSQADAIHALLSILDSPETRLVMARHAHADALRDFQLATIREMAARQDAKAKAMDEDKKAVWEQAENAASAIHRLREELDRVRKHETHLIQARDELIQRLSAAEKRLESIAQALR